jgi:hypothetical protein
MGSDNVTPYKEVLKADIRRELAQAMAAHGGSIELQGIIESWGDTMNDHQVLDTLRKLNRTGSMFDDITDRADD